MANIKNLNSVAQRLRTLAQHKIDGFNRGLIKAGLMLQRESQLLVPVDLGILKASAFTRANGNYYAASPHNMIAQSINRGAVKSKVITVTVGYTAAYAIYVHENLDAAHGTVFNTKYAKEIAERAKQRRKGARGYSPFNHTRGPDQQAKFLEVPFRRMQVSGEIMRIIRSEM